MKKRGTFLGMPYDWRLPNRKKFKERLWNKDNHTLFTPKAFGWGYSINFYELIYRRKILLVVIIILSLLLGALAIQQAYETDRAHNTFDNYFSFRGCVKLLKRTATYGICKTDQGATIKIVKFKGQWYLDGDLPVCTANICF